jgi:acyl-CoA thioesterase-1
MLIPPNYGDDYTNEFAAVFPSLAAEYDTPLIPFFMEGVALDSDKMQADGIHPNTDAQPILMETVWTTLEPELAKQATAKLDNYPQPNLTSQR